MTNTRLEAYFRRNPEGYSNPCGMRQADGSKKQMPKMNLRYIQLTPADAGEALDTIARLEGQGRGVIAARLMEDDPHEPPRWWHVRHFLNLNLLARAAAAQEGTAPSPGNPPPLAAIDDPIAMAAALFRLKAKLNKWRDGAEPVPLALLPTYEGQTWIDMESLDYDPDKPDPHPDACVDEEALYHMRTSLIELLEEIHPTEETIHGARRYICYDESDPNVRVAPDYYFAKGVPGPGIKATGPYLIWAVGKPPDFALEVASPRKAREDLTTKRKLYEKIGIAEYWRVDPTGGQLYGAPLAADRLRSGAYEPIPLHRPEEDLIWGHSEAAGINVYWIDGMFLYRDATPKG